MRLPPVIGHRGAAAVAPENTLAALRAAKALGGSWVEVDLQLTADGFPVILHDERVDRTTDGSGRIGDLTLAQVSSLDAGAWFAPRFAGERVPSLAALLDLLRELELGAVLEVKGGPETARAAAAVLVQQAVALPPLLLSSFDRAALAAVREAAPALPRALNVKEVPADWAETVAALGCDGLHADHRHLDASAVAVLAARVAVRAYTVEDAARARELLGWGIVSVFSGRPDLLNFITDRT